MTRIIHTGDTHLGYRQYHSPERRQDFLDAFQQVVDDAVADDVDAVVHAGDLFHDRRPGLVDLQGTIAVLRQLREAEIPFLAVVGNHEGKRDAQWLDLFEDLGLATRLDDSPYVLGDVAFYGLDFVPRSRREDLDYEFEPTDADHRILVSHGLFEPFAHADWDTERLLGESTVDFDALLLGDNHHPGRENVQGAVVTYCGSTERASASEREDRGYNIVTADGDLTITRRALEDTRDFVFVDVELEGDEGEARIREKVREHDLEDAVVVVTVEGDGDAVTPATIEEFAAERGALVARVNDRRDLESPEGETPDVNFADPDEAVRDRLPDMGLSQVARGIDETVRESKVADSNVREAVEDQVREAMDDPDAFRAADADEVETLAAELDDGGSEPDAPDEDDVARDGTADDASGDGIADDASGDGMADDASGDGMADDASGDGTADDDAANGSEDDVPENGTDQDAPDETATTATEPDGGRPDDPAAEVGDAEDAQERTDDGEDGQRGSTDDGRRESTDDGGDGQTSMEDYL